MGRDRTEKPNQAVKEGASSDNGAKAEKPKRRWWRRNKTESVQTEAHAAEGLDKGKNTPGTKGGRNRGKGKAADATNAEPSAADQRKEANRQRKETEKTLKELGPIDDMGFSLVKRSPTSGKPTKAVDLEPLDFDDCGFPANTYQKVTSINKKKEQAMIDTTPYTSRVDTSTPATTRATLSSVADAARVDAAKLQEEATNLRRSAADLHDMPGMRAEAESLLREASAKEEDAEERLGMAAGFDNQASQVPA
jgi:HD-GYP domain-containing protein (c-di-GMP phosphodiesterase class II)